MAEKKEPFKNYHIGEIIGRGRFAIVYKAEKLDVSKTVALKVLNPEYANRSDIRDQFREQARQQARLSHPRLVRVEDLREEHGQFFVAMEYMPLGNLRRSLTQNGIPPFRETAVIVEDVAEALDYLHGRSLTHGDIKPENIMLVDDPLQKGIIRAKLSDLRIHLATEISQTVSENFVEVSAEYISPEQAEGHANTPLSDQYSLGVVAYEMLCGQPPFTGKSYVDLYIDHQKSSPPSLQNLNDLVTAELEQVVLRALEKSPEKRYSTCGEFARALRTAVVATEQKRLSELLLKAETLMEKQDLGAARTALRDALLIQPDNQRAAQLMARLEHQEQISRNYQLAVSSLEQADAKARHIRKSSGDYPDESGYLKSIAPPPPPYWKQLAHRWQAAGWLALFSSMIFIIGLTTYTAAPPGKPARDWILAITFSPMPTLTAVPTSTSTATPTSTVTPIVTPTVTPTITPTLAPPPPGGGGRIAFSSKQNGFYQIYLADPGSPESTTPILGEPDSRNDEYPVWSPDGNKLAYLSGSQGDYYIFSFDITGSGDQPIKITDQAAYYPGETDFHIEHISWSGDSSKIAYTYKNKPQTNVEYYQIYIMNADGSDSPIPLLQDAAGYNYYFPAWSPTEDKIAYVTDVHGVNYRTICLMNADRSVDPKELTGSQQWSTSPAWSPDGKMIAYVSISFGNKEIYIMNGADGKNPINLTNSQEDDENPVWSPDGSKIAFQRKNAVTGKWDIYIMNSDGTNQKSLVASLDKFPPVWSPDGQMIAYSKRDGNNEIYFIDINNTSNVTRLTSNGIDDNFPSWSR